MCKDTGVWLASLGKEKLLLEEYSLLTHLLVHPFPPTVAPLSPSLPSLSLLPYSLIPPLLPVLLKFYRYAQSAYQWAGKLQLNILKTCTVNTPPPTCTHRQLK